jgi:hypothetical protein
MNYANNYQSGSSSSYARGRERQLIYDEHHSLRRLLLLAGCLLLFLPFITPDLFSEENTTGTGTVSPESKEPVPYELNEFPGWSLKLRRGEIIAFGTLPITFLVTFFAYDIIRFGVHGWDTEYSPFSNSIVKDYSFEEKVGLVTAACSLSVVIAVIDYWIGEVQHKKKEKRQKEKLANEPV